MYESIGHYQVWQANLLLGMYVLGLVPGLLVASAISNYRGRKPALLAGTLLSILASIVLASGFHTFALLCAGRILAGASVGVAMSVGSSWLKELSTPPYDLAATPSAGARRPALTLTLGFGIGAAVSGALAQWGPIPSVMPYAVHIVLAMISLPFLMQGIETLPNRWANGERQWWQDLRITSARHRHFRRLVLPAAPWVFGAAGVAYAIMPSIVQNRLGSWTTIYATFLTVLTLGTGAIVQNMVPRINERTGGHALPVGLGLMFAGMLLAVLASIADNPFLALAVAVILGAAYGTCMVSGLMHVQAIATPQDLAGLTGLYYSLTYTGFLLPAILALALPIASYTRSLLVVAALCFGSFFVVTRTAIRVPRDQGTLGTVGD